MKTKSTNIKWHNSGLPKEEREDILGKGAILWFTGLSGSGKSTVARAVEQTLVESSRNAYVLDGDNLRFGLNSDLGFTSEDRTENIRRVGELSHLFASANILLLAAFISPYRKDRDAIRAKAPSGRFLEIYISASVETCASRDPKGLYEKAMNGEIENFTGISAPYEEPLNPDLIVETGELSLQQCVDKVLDLLRSRDLL